VLSRLVDVLLPIAALAALVVLGPKIFGVAKWKRLIIGRSRDDG
jgi:hypothetical protein